MRMKSDLENKKNFLEQKIIKLKESNELLKENIAKLEFDGLEEEIKEDIDDLLNVKIELVKE